MIKKLVSRNVRLSTKMSRRMCVEKVKEEEEELSVHLRPYDKEKYEQPSGHIKYNSGYAFLDVDPFPRASIMKLCYAILDKLALHIPPHAMYRQYTEEQIKYIMNLTDQIHDIRRLEEQLGFDSIEMFIQSLNDELSLVDDMKSKHIFIILFIFILFPI